MYEHERNQALIELGLILIATGLLTLWWGL